MKTRLFYVPKFKSSRLKQFKFIVEESFDALKSYDEIVMLADNQVLRSIRKITKKKIDFLEVDELYFMRNLLKLVDADNRKEIKRIQDEINKLLYMPEYITIVIENKKHYQHLFEKGLKFNGKMYYRFNASAGQARVSTVVFCSEDILGELNRVLDNGRDLEVPLTPSKYNAYKGLSCSATFEVSEPRYCVIKDFHSNTKVEVDFVTETEKDEDDEIERKVIDQEFNRFDGMGLVTPKQAAIWAKELGLSYTPAQFCIRQNFMKGMLCVFDIHKFCKEKNDGKCIIKSIYGDSVDLREIDVIITESQFKLWDSFKSLDIYNANCKKNGLNWGVSLYTPEHDKDILKMNYQFLQTLNLDKEAINNICGKFKEWIAGVSGENIDYTLLFLMGINNNEQSIKRYLKSGHSENDWVKSLAVYNDLIHDKFIRDKIQSMLKKRIREACLGAILLDGNYQVIVSDPYAFMEFVCGKDVKGLLGAKEYYSNYWNEKKICFVDAMRAPLTGRSEHVKLGLKKNEDTEDWYRHCYTGIILNVHGYETMNFAGSDFDYDIVATTSNEDIINGVYDNEVPVVYNPPKAEKKIFNDRDLYNADLFGFGSIIGQITNKSTIIYSLLSRYSKGSREYKVLMNRLKMCTKLQSQQIDKTKIGREVKGIPKVWNKEDYIEGEDREFYNDLLLDKHPYFFRYLYLETDKRYKEYNKFFSHKVKLKYNMSLDDLLEGKNLDQEKIEMIKNYFFYLPVIYNDGVMNNICWNIEKANSSLKIKPDKEKVKELHIPLMRDVDIKDDKVYRKVINVYKKIKSSRRNEWGTGTVNVSTDVSEHYLDNRRENMIEKFLQVTSDVYKITDCLVYNMYVEKPVIAKYLLWYLFGDVVFENILRNHNHIFKFPILDENGEIEYLNKNYTMKAVKL